MSAKEKKKGAQKLTLDQYLARKENRAKKRFRMELYPWPVSALLLLPFIILILLIIMYFTLYTKKLG